MSRFLAMRIGVAAVWLLLVAGALAVGGIGPMLIVVGFPALAIAAFALIAGNAQWAFVPDRRSAGAVAAAAFALIAVGSATLPTPTPRPLAETPAPSSAAPSTTESTAAPSVLATALSVPPTTTTKRATKTTAPKTTTTTARPQPTTTSVPTTAPPLLQLTAKPGCDPSYPTLCLPRSGPTLSCAQIPQRRFPVRLPDRHGFDNNGDGVGCENR